MRFGGGWRSRVMLTDKNSYRLLFGCTAVSAVLSGILLYRTLTTGFKPMILRPEGEDEEKEYTVRSKYFSRSEKERELQQKSIANEAVEQAAEEQRLQAAETPQ
eukprot:TRINITY_DN19643_c0_g1_i1.p1 TRINITY_DN19643_c0_g1~~TRINITY_DN19643_c0_g1_i1.p1  ORF type:complete len:104 (-),score=4.41 TRINITY_DN19643_c0_g1_i1:180-491(-)